MKALDGVMYETNNKNKIDMEIIELPNGRAIFPNLPAT